MRATRARPHCASAKRESLQESLLSYLSSIVDKNVNEVKCRAVPGSALVATIKTIMSTRRSVKTIMIIRTRTTPRCPNGISRTAVLPYIGLTSLAQEPPTTTRAILCGNPETGEGICGKLRPRLAPSVEGSSSTIPLTIAAQLFAKGTRQRASRTAHPAHGGESWRRFTYSEDSRGAPKNGETGILPSRDRTDYGVVSQYGELGGL